MEFIIAGPDEVGGASEYLNLVDSLPASAVLIDQRLGESSSAPYTGLELAGSLRAIRPMLPIFILTKWVEEDQLEEKGFVVDDIMDRTLLNRYAASYVGRLLRSMRRYEESRSEQSKRMHTLIAESLYRELNDDETAELIRLRADIGIAGLGREIEMAEKGHIRLENKKDILDALKRLVEEEK